MIKIKSTYELHRVPYGSRMTYTNKETKKQISGILVEVLPNTGQYLLKRKRFNWKHYIQWDVYNYSYHLPGEFKEDEKPPKKNIVPSTNVAVTSGEQHIIPSTTISVPKRSKSKKKKRGQEISFSNTDEGDLVVNIN